MSDYYTVRPVETRSGKTEYCVVCEADDCVDYFATAEVAKDFAGAMNMARQVRIRQEFFDS